MASASSSLASGFPIDASVTFLFAVVNVHLPCVDSVVYEKVSECVKRDIYNNKNTKQNALLSSVSSPPHSKILGTPLLCPVIKMKGRHLCICLSCHFVCILLGSFCDHCKNVW